MYIQYIILQWVLANEKKMVNPAKKLPIYTALYTVSVDD